ncbi:MAG: YkgJ family cysteine cluster protein [Candidatus Thorarchaeota archaeon]
MSPLGNNTRESNRNNVTGIKFECIQCGACCRQNELLVTLTARDAYSLASALGLTAENLLRAVDFYILKEDDESPVGLQQIPQVKTEKGPAYLALRKLEDGSCIFLKDDLCMVHVVRPSVCRSFPFVFRRKSGELTWGLSALKEICPGLGTGKDITKTELIELGGIVLEDLEIYSEFADDWNSADDNLTALGLIEAILSDTRSII